MTTTNNGGDLMANLQEQTYAAISPDGTTDYFYAKSMFAAYIEAHQNYGPGVVIRPAWYGEWDCGTEPGGPCYYDKYGTHLKRDADGTYKPVNLDRYDADATELEAMNG